ncbi:MAG TPA: aldo/keto reductase, partial [Saprospiraceae bacterium]|nr:aldo/keto reductase [Saprospiraceae bacterium]
THDYKFNEGDNRPDSKYFKPGNIDRVQVLMRKIKPIADAHNASLAQVVINWTTRQPAMGCVLVGARDEKQVHENAGALDFTLSDSELEYLQSAVEATVLTE